MIKVSESVMAKPFNQVRHIIMNRLFNFLKEEIKRILRKAFVGIRHEAKECQLLIPFLRIQIGQEYSYKFNTILDSTYQSRNRVYHQGPLLLDTEKAVNKMAAIRHTMSSERYHVT